MSVIMPGSYDPVTVGHTEMIRRVAEREDEVYVVAIGENAEYLENYIEELDEDLGMVEEDLYCGEDDEDEDDDVDFDCDEEDFDEDDDDDDDEEVVVVTCPQCGDGVYLDDTMDFDDIKCPSCGATFSCTCESCESCDGCGGCED